MKIKLHPLFLAFAILLTALGGFFNLISALFAVLLHEAAHAKVAANRGYRLEEITLMPYGAALKICNKLSQKDAAAVLSAGIIANFLFAFLSAALWWLLPEAYPYTYPLVQANLAIGGINLLPCLPLDGGRLFSVFVKNKKLCAAVNLIAGIAAIAVFILLFVLSCFAEINFSLLVFALFLGGYMVFPQHSAALEFFNKKNNFSEVKEVIIHEKTPLYKILRKAEQNSYSRFTVTDKKGNCLGCIEENKLSDYAAKYPADTIAAELIYVARANAQ